MYNGWNHGVAPSPPTLNPFFNMQAQQQFQTAQQGLNAAQNMQFDVSGGQKGCNWTQNTQDKDQGIKVEISSLN